MALSPSQIQEVLGTVVPVDGEKDVTFIVPSGSSSGIRSNVPSQPVPTGPGPPATGGICGHKKHIYT